MKRRSFLKSILGLACGLVDVSVSPAQKSDVGQIYSGTVHKSRIFAKGNPGNWDGIRLIDGGTRSDRVYCDNLDEACQAAGTGSGWDARFISALKERGMGIAPMPAWNDDLYPDGFAYTAPRPHDNAATWDKDACIVWLK